MRDTEVGCKACADEFRGFGSARSTLEESQKESGNHLCNGLNERPLFFTECEEQSSCECTSVVSKLPAPSSHNVFGRCFAHSSNLSSTSLLRLDLNEPVYSRSVRSYEPGG